MSSGPASAAASGPVGLRPLGIGEILDVAIKVYLRHWRTLIKLVVLVEVPVQLVGFVIQLSTLPDSALRARGGFASTGSGTASSVDTAASLAGTGIVAVLGLAAAALASAACLKAVSDAYLGEQPSWRTSVRYALRRVHSVVWVQILVAVLAILAALALIVPGVWLWVSWSVAVPALLLEDVRGFGALGRSFGLVRQRWWATFGVGLLTALAVAVVGGAIQALFFSVLLTGANASALAVLALSTLGATLAGILTRPFQAAVPTILYFDLRVRKEGLDVQLLAHRLGIAERSGSPLALLAPPQFPTAGDPGGQAPPYWPPPPGWRRPGDGTGAGSAPALGPGSDPASSGPAPPYWPPPGWQRPGDGTESG